MINFGKVIILHRESVKTNLDDRQRDLMINIGVIIEISRKSNMPIILFQILSKLEFSRTIIRRNLINMTLKLIDML